MNRRNYEMDMCSGPIFPKIVAFALPLMLSGILQLLYNAVGVVVVGRFAGDTALAAVGSTGSLSALIINVFLGLSVGGSVTVAQHYGAGRYKDVSESVHTAVALSVIGGVLVGIFGIVMAKPLLKLMNSPDDVIDQAALYMRIYFIGMPANMGYNFGSGILRAIGDTRRPLMFLTIAGLVNVALTLLFVVKLGMGVAGVAAATIIAQTISFALTIVCLMRTDGAVHLDLRRIRVYKDKLIAILKIGLPAGLQGSVFSISNVLIQSSINSFGSTVLAANSAAGNLEGFVYTGMNALHQSALTFASQNMGAKRFDRLGKILTSCIAAVCILGVTLGIACYVFAGPLLSIYTNDPEVVRIGTIRLLYLCVPYFICGVMDVLAGQLRGMGCSIPPMIISIVGVCGVRITWIYTIFAWTRSLEQLYLSYPISWGLTGIAHAICFFVLYRQLKRRNDIVSEGDRHAAQG